MTEKIYLAGIYARLSVDSGDRKNESIETQVEIAKEFIRQQDDMEVYDIYTDTGRSGTNFEREGFERMMRDIRQRKVSCIVVKDLSRFGRNHIETGNYIEKIFPFMGVRFIAVTDHFDSMNMAGQDEAMSVNLKNLVNEMYAKDIAVKVKASRKAKWEQGSYTGGTAPYGYRAEWMGDKKCLFIEEDAADIVRKIFDLFLSGSKLNEIVRWLYGHKVARPAQYHKTGQVYFGEAGEQWPRASVRMILTNPAYIGCLVQGRTCGKEHMMRGRHDIDLGDWSVKEHTHEAIISEELFFEAAGKFEKSAAYCNKSGFSKKVPLEEDLFAGVLCCGDCGSRLKRTSAVRELGSKDKVRIYSYHCPKSDRIDRLKCPEKRISLCALTEIVKETIRQEVILSGLSLKDIEEIIYREGEGQKKEWSGRLAVTDRKLERIMFLGSEQYLKYRMGELDEGAFRRAKKENDKQAASIQKERKAITEKLKEIDSGTQGKVCFLHDFMKSGGKGKLTPEIVRTLINRIEVYPKHSVKVVFAFGRSRLLTEKEGVSDEKVPDRNLSPAIQRG